MVTDVAAPALEATPTTQPDQLYYIKYAWPGQYQPLTELELNQQPNLEARVKKLATQADRLEAQLFGHIQKRYVSNGAEVEMVLPEQTPTDSEWEDYLIGQQMYHEQAKRQATLTHDVEGNRQHELEEMRANLALGALRGENSRGDLVVNYARRVKANVEKAKTEVPNSPWMQLYNARIELADRMIGAMEERFSQKQKKAQKNS